MSNLEHLVENGLDAFDRGFGYHEWLKQMRKDPNWEGVERLTIDDLWEICQYVYYSWMPCRDDEPQSRLDRCYKCVWWNYSYGCKCKKGICEFETKIGCVTCKWDGDKQVCGRCRSGNLYAPKDEPQTE